MNVYIIESGMYSDRSVFAVCSSRQKADNLIRSMRVWEKQNKNCQEAYSITKVVLDELIDKISAGYLAWHIIMGRDGSILKKSQKNSEYYAYMCSKSGYQGNSRLDCFVWAKDETGAIKIMNDRRCQLIANNKWVEI